MFRKRIGRERWINTALDQNSKLNAREEHFRSHHNTLIVFSCVSGGKGGVQVKSVENNSDSKIKSGELSTPRISSDFQKGRKGRVNRSSSYAIKWDHIPAISSNSGFDSIQYTEAQFIQFIPGWKYELVHPHLPSLQIEKGIQKTQTRIHFNVSEIRLIGKILQMKEKYLFEIWNQRKFVYLCGIRAYSLSLAGWVLYQLTYKEAILSF